MLSNSLSKLFAIGALACSVVSHVGAQQLARDMTFTQSTEGDVTLRNLLPGDYVKIQIDSRQGPPNAYLYAIAHAPEDRRSEYGVTRTNSWGKPTDTLEFFSKGDAVNIRYSFWRSDQGSTSARLRIWHGRGDVVLEKIELVDKNVRVWYRMNNGIPWDWAGRNIQIHLHFATSPSPDDIIMENIAGGGVVDSGLHFKTGSKSVDFPFSELPLPPHQGLFLIATFDWRRELVEQRMDNNTAWYRWSFVPQVPHIERLLGYETAAEIQDRWLSRRAAWAQVNKDGNAVFGVNLRLAEKGKLDLDDTSLTMDWALSRSSAVNSRVIDARNKLPGKLGTQGALRELRRLIYGQAKQSRGKTITFGNLRLRGSALADQHTTHEMVKGNLIIDEVNLILGNFSLYAIPTGKAKMDKSGKITGQITGYGVFLGDVFDFSGELPLGFWRMYPPRISWYHVNDHGVNNALYRQYRDFTGLGRDCVLMSKAKSYRLPTPIPFSFK